MTKKRKKPGDTAGRSPKGPPPASRSAPDLLLPLVPRRAGRAVPGASRRDRAFLGRLAKAASDREFREGLRRLRDAVLRSYLAREGRGGRIVAMAGVRGGEGASTFALLLAMALGSSRHYRVAYIDGRLDAGRFEAFTGTFGLSKNSFHVEKDAEGVSGYYNESVPNVYFLRSGPLESLQFFSDKQLQGFLGALRDEFDFTILDVPPLLSESSHVFVLPSVDELYLVAASGKTKLIDIDECIGLAQETGVDISGVVLRQRRVPVWSRRLWRGYFG